MQYPIAGLFCLELFALSVALMVIFGDSMITIFPNLNPTSFKLLGFCLVLPTVFIPFKILSYTSLIGLFSSLTLVSVLLIDGFYKESAPGCIFQPSETSLWPSSKWGLSAGLMMSGVSHTSNSYEQEDCRRSSIFNIPSLYPIISLWDLYTTSSQSTPFALVFRSFYHSQLGTRHARSSRVQPDDWLCVSSRRINVCNHRCSRISDVSDNQ